MRRRFWTRIAHERDQVVLVDSRAGTEDNPAAAKHYQGADGEQIRSFEVPFHCQSSRGSTNQPNTGRALWASLFGQALQTRCVQKKWQPLVKGLVPPGLSNASFERFS